MIGLIMLGSVINYLTRSTLAVAVPTLLHQLQISTKEYSWIVGAFQGAIMAQLICGYVLDVLGLKLGFAIFAVAWSIWLMPSQAVGRPLPGFAGFSGSAKDRPTRRA
jgi:ACS family hexuronate transporter-like MFS transporter